MDNLKIKYLKADILILAASIIDNTITEDDIRNLFEKYKMMVTQPPLSKEININIPINIKVDQSQLKELLTPFGKSESTFENNDFHGSFYNYKKEILKEIKELDKESLEKDVSPEDLIETDRLRKKYSDLWNSDTDFSYMVTNHLFPSDLQYIALSGGFAITPKFCQIKSYYKIENSPYTLYFKGWKECAQESIKIFDKMLSNLIPKKSSPYFMDNPKYDTYFKSSNYPGYSFSEIYQTYVPDLPNHLRFSYTTGSVYSILPKESNKEEFLSKYPKTPIYNPPENRFIGTIETFREFDKKVKSYDESWSGKPHNTKEELIHKLPELVALKRKYQWRIAHKYPGFQSSIKGYYTRERLPEELKYIPLSGAYAIVPSFYRGTECNLKSSPYALVYREYPTNYAPEYDFQIISESIMFNTLSGTFGKIDENAICRCHGGRAYCPTLMGHPSDNKCNPKCSCYHPNGRNSTIMHMSG